MAIPQSLSRHGTLPPEGGRVRRLLLLLVLFPVLLPALCVSYLVLVPPYSASFYVKDVRTTVTVSFYWVWNDMFDNGRRMTLRTPRGALTHAMCGYDWAHWARTGVYLTKNQNIAVVGPDGCDYLVSITDRTVTKARDMPSDKWSYLGAFDFVGYPRGGNRERALRFIPASEQAECIEMMGDLPAYAYMVRRAARKPRCL